MTFKSSRELDVVLLNRTFLSKHIPYVRFCDMICVYFVRSTRAVVDICGGYGLYFQTSFDVGENVGFRDLKSSKDLVQKKLNILINCSTVETVPMVLGIIEPNVSEMSVGIMYKLASLLSTWEMIQD